jgi:Ca2+-binding EF-hand superfamily protein
LNRVELASQCCERDCAKKELLPKKLRMLLKRHRAPVRTLFSTLDGNLDGAITRHELWTSLQAIGVPLCLEDADLLFRALLEFAIGKGEVSLSVRAVQKALLMVVTQKVLH